MPKTFVTLSSGKLQEFEHVETINIAPGFVMLQNAHKDVIGLFNATQVESITQPANDTDIQIGKLVTQH